LKGAWAHSRRGRGKVLERRGKGITRIAILTIGARKRRGNVRRGSASGQEARKFVGGLVR